MGARCRGDLVSSGVKAIVEIEAVLHPILVREEGILRTHFEGCYEHHIACLAEYLREICARVTS